MASSIKYGDTFSTNHSCRTFDDFVDYRYRLNLGQCGLCVIGDDEINYYPDWLKIGEEYFVGKQHVQFNEKREEYPYGVYKLTGKTFDTLLFEGRDGKKIEVRCQTVILKKIRIIEAQAKYGFYFPMYLKKVWPDLEEYTANMPGPEYEVGVEPGVRNYIDAFLTLIIWVLGIVFLKSIKGGSFSFNFWGSTAYYLWIIIGAIIVMVRFTRKKKW